MSLVFDLETVHQAEAQVSPERVSSLLQVVAAARRAHSDGQSEADAGLNPASCRNFHFSSETRDHQAEGIWLRLSPLDSYRRNDSTAKTIFCPYPPLFLNNSSSVRCEHRSVGYSPRQ